MEGMIIMTHEERRIWLIKKLLSERIEYRKYQIPDYEKGQKDMLRSLMNVRMPKPASEEVLAIQDSYLKGRALERGIVNAGDIETVNESLGSSHDFADSISVWQGDITLLAADAIVNAANSQMLGCFIPMHSCIDNCIHTYAGV